MGGWTLCIKLWSHFLCCCTRDNKGCGHSVPAATVSVSADDRRMGGGALRDALFVTYGRSPPSALHPMPDHTTPDRHRDHTVSLSLYAKVCLHCVQVFPLV